MLGDTCSTCNESHANCTCAEPCLPGGANSECEDWVDFKCVFWMGDPIPNTTIKKGTRGTEIIQQLISRIATLEQQVAILQGGA
jgi:hypothetical protein